MRRGIKAVLFAAVALLAVNAVRLGWQQVEAQAQPMTPLASGNAVVPYTVVLSERVTSKTGRVTQGPPQTWAVRSDGAFVVKLDEGDVGSRQVIFPDGTRAELSDSRRVKSTITKPHDSPWLKDPLQSCAPLPHRAEPTKPAKQFVAIETIQGHRAARFTDAGATTWFAIDAGCATIKRVQNFAEGGASELTLVSLITGPPNDALFAVPPDYQEGPPSSFRLPSPAKCDVDCQESTRKHFERLDAQYFQYHVNK